VEPSRVQAAIIKGYLEEQSLPVVGAVVNGSDAIQAVRSLRPRAVVSAMHLSDISGVDLARQIRAEIKVDAPGFVLVTSEADDGESSSLSQLNRVLTLKKPFTAGQMAEALRVVTGTSNSLKFGGKVPRSQLRVLIVDDSSTARIQVRTVLQGLGFSLFTEVPDGAYAIAVAARESCDLIVTDYNMPLMDGRALVSYLKQNPPTSAIPIVMVTTETEPRILDPVRKLGVVAVLEKAFPASVVGALMDSLFGSP
jgi:two-component system chemotaxis response regulator CheY